MGIPWASDFGTRLRWWRRRRGLSQLDLAAQAGSSQRHISFLESGRTRPSRRMVLRLAMALEVPLRQQNALLQAAGFALAWPESELSAPALAEVDRALGYMLERQEPYPAVVVDRRWNLLRANAAAARLTAFLTEPAAAPAGETSNLAEAMLSPEGLRPWIVNWEEAAAYFVWGIQADAAADGTRQTADLLRRLLALPGVADLARRAAVDSPTGPVLTLHFSKGGISLRLFTTIATLDTPHDVTLQEIRIESFFAADLATARVFQDWAERAP